MNETTRLQIAGVIQGPPGPKGDDGEPGISAYELAVSNGYQGTEEEWIASLKGEPGRDGKDGLPGEKGEPGENATDEQVRTAVNNYMEENQPESLEIDATLTKSGKASDAKVTGDRIKKNSDDIQDLHNSKADIITETVFAKKLAIKDARNDTPLKSLNIYGKSTQLTTTGAQLLDPSLRQPELSIGGLEFISNNDGSITVKGEQTGAGPYWNYFLGNHIDLLEDGKTYILNCDEATGTIVIRYIDESKSPTYNIKVTVNKSTMASIEPIFQFNTITKPNKEIYYPMLNEGDKKKLWEPYSGKKPSPSIPYPQDIKTIGKKGFITAHILSGDLCDELTLQTPNGLPGVSVSSGGNYTDENGQQYICDEIDLERGKYIQRVASESIKGGWKLQVTESKPNVFKHNNRFTHKFTMGNTGAKKSSHFSYSPYASTDEYTFDIEVSTCYISLPENIVGIAEEDASDILNSIEEPIIFIGKLATPIERDLTPEEINQYRSMRLYHPLSVITNDDGAFMKVKYDADTTAYLNKPMELIETYAAEAGLTTFDIPVGRQYKNAMINVTMTISASSALKILCDGTEVLFVTTGSFVSGTFVLQVLLQDYYGYINGSLSKTIYGIQNTAMYPFSTLFTDGMPAVITIKLYTPNDTSIINAAKAEVYAR